MSRMTPDAPTPAPVPRRLWDRLCRFNLTHARPTRRSLDRFCRSHATGGPVLVVHCVDLDHRRHFPGAFVVSSRGPADLAADPEYGVLDQLPAASRDLAVCTGLLEHVADPQQLADQLARVLRPGGRLVLSASAVFPFHGSPRNYFHFTPGGLRHLFRDWSRVETIRGSTRPYATLGVLVQRINLQCDVVPPVRLLNELLMRLLPLLDVFVLREHDTMARRDAGSVAESIMPATLHAVVVR